MQVRMKKRPSINKVNKEKQFNMTVSTALFPSSQKQLKQLPPIKRNLRKPLQKISSGPKSIEKKQRRQTQTTLNESSISMQQSYFFTTLSKGWIKPSDYLQNIEQLNLEDQDEKVSITSFQIKLSDKIQQNVKKIESMFQLTEKWVDILKRALFYVTSQKSNSNKLNEQVKFWRLLSKKFDELEYEFNNQRTIKLKKLMMNSLKMNPQHRKTFEQYESLKQKVSQQCISIKKLYMSLEQIVSGLISRFEQSSDIKESIQLLRRIIFSFDNLSELNPFLHNRLQIIYRKVNIALISKLLAAPIYPRELANISGLKLRYEIIDKAISFYSNFLSIIQQKQQKFHSIIEEAEYTRNVISNLMSILCYFEYLYKKREVLEFSKLFGYQIDFNIFDPQNKHDWEEYMALVQESMERNKYQD